MKPNIWIYWDNPPSQIEAPAYIQLCRKTIYRYCAKDFDIHLITTANVKQFLPNIPSSFFQIAQINNKSNYLRYMLLREYGGIWLDSDLVLFQSLKPMLELLNDEVDLVATASPTLNYGEPECGFLLSTKGGTVITKAVSIIDYAIKLQRPGHIFTWGSLGPKTIREAVKGRGYHHLDSRLLMPIASWHAHLFNSIESVDKYCIDNAYGFMLFHEMFRQSNSQFLSMSKEQLLNSPTLLGSIFRKALNTEA